MNNFTISGNLAKDPWVADSGKAMRITVAVSKGYKADKAKEEKAKGNQTADFFDVMVFSEAYIAFCFVDLSPVLSCLLITFCISFPCLRQRFRQTRISLALSLFAHLTENRIRLHHLNKGKMFQR